MGRAIDLFVTYRFVKLLTTPFEKTDAFKMGIIDKDGFRTKKILYKQAEQNSYTVLHKLVFNIKRIFAKVPGLRTRLGTYAAALFLLKDTFKDASETHIIFNCTFQDHDFFRVLIFRAVSHLFSTEERVGNFKTRKIS